MCVCARRVHDGEERIPTTWRNAYAPASIQYGETSVAFPVHVEDADDDCARDPRAKTTGRAVQSWW